MTTTDQTRHPAIQSVLRHFNYSQLPDPLWQLSRHFHDLAHMTVAMIRTDDPQLTLCLQKLVEAKDCAVRAYRIDLETRHAPPASTADLDQRDKLESRWRGIDPQGNVATEPTPDPPDDPDEGETGPPETTG